MAIQPARGNNQMTFDTMDKGTAKAIGATVTQLLREAMEAHGVTVKRGTGSYDPEAGTLGIRFTFSVAGADSPEVFAFKQYHYRFPAYELGATFVSNGHKYTLAGYKPRAPKRPFVAKRSNGDSSIFGWDVMERGLGNKDGDA